MTKMISIKIDDELYSEMMAYATMNGKNLSGMCRAMIKRGFFNALQQDASTLARYDKMLFDSSKFQLSTRELLDIEEESNFLRACTIRFSDLFSTLAAELYATGELLNQGDNEDA